jgi:hypothetical protein
MANLKYNKELGTKVDYNVYIDTDSIYMLAEPLVKHRFPEYKTFDEKRMASVVNDIAEETQAFLNKQARYEDVLAAQASVSEKMRKISLGQNYIYNPKTDRMEIFDQMTHGSIDSKLKVEKF